jgi:hypothetical protein
MVIRYASWSRLQGISLVRFFHTPNIELYDMILVLSSMAYFNGYRPSIHLCGISCIESCEAKFN